MNILIPIGEISNPNLANETRIFDVENYINMIAADVKKNGRINQIILNSKKEVQVNGGRYLFEALKRNGATHVYCVTPDKE